MYDAIHNRRADERHRIARFRYRTARFRVYLAARPLRLPVVGAVVLRVGAGGVLHDDGITGAEVVEEPPCVGGADVDAAVADVSLALIVNRPWSAVYEVAAVVEPDG